MTRSEIEKASGVDMLEVKSDGVTNPASEETEVKSK